MNDQKNSRMSLESHDGKKMEDSGLSSADLPEKSRVKEEEPLMKKEIPRDDDEIEELLEEYSDLKEQSIRQPKVQEYEQQIYSLMKKQYQGKLPNSNIDGIIEEELHE